MGLININTELRRRYEFDLNLIEDVGQHVIGTTTLALSNPLITEVKTNEVILPVEGVITLKANKNYMFSFGTINPKNCVMVHVNQILIQHCNVSCNLIFTPNKSPLDLTLMVTPKFQLSFGANINMISLVAVG